MFDFCRACDARTLHVLGGCSVCLAKSFKGDELATEVLQRKVVEEQMELQLEAHPEVGEDECTICASQKHGGRYIPD